MLLVRGRPGYSGLIRLIRDKNMGGRGGGLRVKQSRSRIWRSSRLKSGQFPLVPTPHFATTIREANVSFGEIDLWRPWEASPIVSCGETNSWRAWEAKFPLSMWKKNQQAPAGIRVDWRNSRKICLSKLRLYHRISPYVTLSAKKHGGSGGTEN